MVNPSLLHDTMRAAIDARWSGDFLDALQDMVRIPAVSPSFSPDWEADGHIEEIIQYAAEWLRAQNDPDLGVRISRLPGRTPLLIATMPGSTADAQNVLLYGHLDKQPAGEGWTIPGGAWNPTLNDGYLFGRGSADDVYSLFAMWGAICAAKASGAGYPACTLLLEGSEESSSCDLPAHMDALASVIGQPDLVICLDAFTPNYERLWATSSLRGIVVMDLTVDVLDASTHSGDAGSIVPSPFRILRELLDRVEDATDGSVLLPELTTAVPASVSDVITGMVRDGLTTPMSGFPVLAGVESDQASLFDEFLRRAWSPSVTYAGMDGFPSSKKAASIILPGITVRLSIRTPPDLDPDIAAGALVEAFTKAPPSGARVKVDVIAAEAGWPGTELTDILTTAVTAASERNFGAAAGQFAAGVTIPFVGMLSRRFPAAKVLTIGALGPDSNPHAPDESLNLAAAAKVTACVADILVDGFVK